MPAMPSRVRWVMLGALATVVCAAGSLPALAARSAPGPNTRARAAKRHKRRMVKLRGTMRVRSFTFRAGTTYVATGTLKIMARRNVTVNGPIELAAGAGLSIRAGGELVIRAAIGPAPAAASAAASAAQAVAGCKPEPIVDFQALGIKINSSITGDPGATGADGQGCDGGNVLVGAAYRDIVLGPGASIRGGRGGDGGKVSKRVGFTNGCTSNHDYRPTGVPPGATFEQTGNGGDGGNVTLKTGNVAIGTDVVGPETAVVGGFGGDGGFLADDSEPMRALTAPNGTEAERGGGDVAAITGSGGRGGNATLFEEFIVRHNRRMPFGRGGPGGAPGGAVLAAGDGGPPNCDGGDFLFGAGHPGAPGTGGIVQPVRHAPLEDLTLIGGNAYPQAPPNPYNGGNGGAAYVYDQPTLMSGLHEANLNLIRADAVGDGGPGSNGCAVSPAVHGGEGGAGGFLGRYGGPDANIAASFNGGAGGDGNSPGDGGLASRPLSAPFDAITASFHPGPSGNPCPGTPPPQPTEQVAMVPPLSVTPPTEQVAFSGNPFSAGGITTFVQNASAPAAPSDPNDVFALGSNSGGGIYVTAIDVATDGPDTAVGGGSGYFQLPSGPSYEGLTRVGPSLTVVWANGGSAIDYSEFDDAGTMIGSGSLSAGTVDFATVQVFNVQAAGGPVAYFAGIDLNSHHDAVMSADVSSSGMVTVGPCSPTVFSTIGTFGATGLAVDPVNHKLGFAGLLSSADNGVFFTDDDCSNPTTPVSLGAAAGDTVPTATFAGAGDIFVYGTVPLPGNDEAPVVYKVDETGTKVSTFTTFQGVNADQAGATGLFPDGADVVGIGDLSTGAVQGYSPAINATTGTLDASVSPNPFTFLPAGAMYLLPQSAQQPSAGTVVVFGNTDTTASVTVLTGVP